MEAKTYGLRNRHSGQSQVDRRQGDGDHDRADAEHRQSQGSAPSDRGERVVTFGSQAAHSASSGVHVPKYSDTTRYFRLTPYPAGLGVREVIGGRDSSPGLWLL
jgi:hypothetical protein